MNTWPDGVRKPLTQSEHEAWNSYNYPGTRQTCSICGVETGRCEEDSLYLYNTDQPICEDCYCGEV